MAYKKCKQKKMGYSKNYSENITNFAGKLNY